MINLKLKNWISQILNFNIQNIFISKNNDILPPQTETFIILNHLYVTRLNTPQTEINTNKIVNLVSSSYQIDFYRDTNNTLINKLFIQLSSGECPKDVNMINITPIRNLSDVQIENRFIHRYSLDVEFSHYIEYENIDQLYFTDAKIDLIPIPKN